MAVFGGVEPVKPYMLRKMDRFLAELSAISMDLADTNQIEFWNYFHCHGWQLLSLISHHSTVSESGHFYTPIHHQLKGKLASFSSVGKRSNQFQGKLDNTMCLLAVGSDSKQPRPSSRTKTVFHAVAVGHMGEGLEIHICGITSTRTGDKTNAPQHRHQ